MKLTAIQGAAAAGVALITAQTAQAETPEINTSGLARIDTRISEDGTCLQRLPNIITNTDIGKDWRVSAAAKVDNLDAANGCTGNHDARLFFLNATYKGLQAKHGTTIQAGVLAPFALTQYPLNHGFTQVMLGDKHNLYGGIAGVKLNQRVIANDTTSLNVNAGLGTKPGGLERFGPTADRVAFAGFDLSHKFTERLIADTGAEIINFADNTNPEGTDIYGYGRVRYDGEAVDLTLYGEGRTGERKNAATRLETDNYSIMGSATFDLSSQTDWEVAAGLVDGAETAETSLYHDFGDGFRSTIGYGHKFDSGEDVVRFGLIKAF